MENTARWTIKVSKDTDISLRTYLAQQGMKKGDLSKFIEHAVADHGRGLDHQTEWMTQGMHGIVSGERVHAHVMERADMDGKTAA